MTAPIVRACYLLPGQSIKIKTMGVFVKHGKHPVEQNDGVTVEKDLVNGYAVDDPNVGSIESVENEPAIIYTHRKYGANRIVFVGAQGQIGYVDIISVPIHDHASIVTGGPAYGTYFTDDETLEGGNNG